MKDEVRRTKEEGRLAEPVAHGARIVIRAGVSSRRDKDELRRMWRANMTVKSEMAKSTSGCWSWCMASWTTARQPRYGSGSPGTRRRPRRMRAQRAAGVFAAAAKWHEAPIPMRSAEFGVRNEEGTTLAPGAVTKVSTGRASGTHTHANSHSALRTPHSALDHDSVAPLRRALQWAVALAATVLFAFLLGGYLHHRGRLSEVAARHLRVTVTGPSQLVPGVAGEYKIKTTDVLGEPQSVKLQCTLFDMAGQKINSEIAHTGADGSFDFVCPSTTAVSAAARLEVLAFHRDESYRLEAAVPVAPYRFLTRVSTDKPLYRPGEIVRFRSLTLGRFGLDTPAICRFTSRFTIRPAAVVAGSEHQGITQRGVGNGEFLLPPDRPGGEYKLVARSLDGAFPEEKRKFFVREYRVPELKKDLEFIRDSYTPGDRVAADLAVNKGKGGAGGGAQLTITATVDGQVVHQATEKASDAGACRVEFDLPKAIERGDGQLAIQCDDGGVRETIAKTIPINLGKVEVKLYPEGGDLVAGLENRVYFAAKQPAGQAGACRRDRWSTRPATRWLRDRNEA